MFKIVLSEPKPLIQVVPDLDPRFAAIVSKAMARDADQRYGSAAEMIEALDALGLAFAGTGAGHGAWTAVPVVSGEHQPVQALPSPGQATQGAFSASQQGVLGATAPGKRSGAAIAAAVAVLVLGGGAFGAYKVFGSKPGVEAEAERTPSATAVSAPPPPAEAVQPAPKEAATAAPTAVEGPAVAPSATVAPSAATAPSVAARAPVVGRPRAAPRPTAQKTATPTGTKPPTPGKSSRDFGY
jgi:serine/threonine-protein kinase